MPIQTRSATAKKVQPVAHTDNKYEKPAIVEKTKQPKTQKSRTCDRKQVVKAANTTKKEKNVLKARNQNEGISPSTSGRVRSNHILPVQEVSDEENISAQRNSGDNVCESLKEVGVLHFRSQYGKFSQFLQTLGNPANDPLPTLYDKITQDAFKRLEELASLKKRHTDDPQAVIAQTPLGRKVISGKDFIKSQHSQNITLPQTRGDVLLSESGESATYKAVSQADFKPPGRPFRTCRKNTVTPIPPETGRLTRSRAKKLTLEQQNSFQGTDAPSGSQNLDNGASSSSSLCIETNETSQEKKSVKTRRNRPTKRKVEPKLPETGQNVLKIPDHFDFHEKSPTQSAKKRVLESPYPDVDCLVPGPAAPGSCFINNDYGGHTGKTEKEDRDKVSTVVAAAVLFSQSKSKAPPKTLSVVQKIDKENKADDDSIPVVADAEYKKNTVVVFSNRVQRKSSDAANRIAESKKKNEKHAPRVSTEKNKKEANLKNIFACSSSVKSSTPIEKPFRGPFTKARKEDVEVLKLVAISTPTASSGKKHTGPLMNEAMNSSRLNSQLKKAELLPSNTETKPRNTSATAFKSAGHETPKDIPRNFQNSTKPIQDVEYKSKSPFLNVAVVIDSDDEDQVSCGKANNGADIRLTEAQKSEAKQQDGVRITLRKAVNAKRSVDERKEAVFLDERADRNTIADLVVSVSSAVNKNSSRVDLPSDAVVHKDVLSAQHCSVSVASGSPGKTSCSSKPVLNCLTPKHSGKSTADFGHKHNGGKHLSISSISSSGSTASKTPANFVKTAHHSKDKILSESNSNPSGCSWYFKPTHTASTNTCAESTTNQKKRLEELQRIQEKQEESLRKKEILLQQKKNLQKQKNDEWKAKIDKKKAEDVRVKSHLTKEENFNKQFKGGSNHVVSTPDAKANPRIHPLLLVTPTTLPASSSTAASISKNPILKKQGTLAQKVLGSVGNFLWSRKSDIASKNEAALKKGNAVLCSVVSSKKSVPRSPSSPAAPASSNNHVHTLKGKPPVFVSDIPLTQPTSPVSHQSDSTLNIKYCEVLPPTESTSTMDVTYDVEHVSNYDITCYEDLDDDMEHRRQKQIPSWAKDEEHLHLSLLMQQPDLVQLLRLPSFPRKQLEYKIFSDARPRYK